MMAFRIVLLFSLLRDWLLNIDMITLTEQAYKKVKFLLEKRGKGAGIRLGVKTTGCSGLAYTLEYVDEYKAEVGVTNFAQPDFCVLVDAKSLAYMDNMTIDWVRNGLNEGFEFQNPNERDKCGCGESFRV
jgi:iron-sulfur cluster assembly protein